MMQVSTFMTENKINLDDWFRCHDTLKNGTINLESFQTMFKRMDVPLSKIEMYSIFKYFVTNVQKQNFGKESKVYFKDFSRALNNSI